MTVVVSVDCLGLSWLMEDGRSNLCVQEKRVCVVCACGCGGV